MITRFRHPLFLILVCTPLSLPVLAEGFTQQDRELLIRLQVQMEEIDKRFEQVDKRFELVDKRFDQVDKRFEQVDKRFDQVDKQFEQFIDFLYILSGIFTSLVAGVFVFAWWDRRSMLSKAREAAYDTIHQDLQPMREANESDHARIDAIISALRKMAEKSPEAREALRSTHLLG